MKLEDIKAPKGYQIQGFNYPSVGDYILLPSGEEFKIDTHHHAYHCGGIILKKVWEPEIGALYEFSDEGYSFTDNEYGIFSGYNKDPESKFKYRDEEGTAWAFIKPVSVPIGK